MNGKTAPVLVIGYGNPGRGDDGLGPAFAESLEELNIEGVRVEASYQLTVEDAAALAVHEVVLFVDAAMEGPEPFRLERIRPRFSAGFSTHHIDPPALLAMARELFGATAEAYVLAIRGYEFDDFGEALSEHATANLGAALEFVVPALRRGAMRKDPPEHGDPDGPAATLETRSSYA